MGDALMHMLRSWDGSTVRNIFLERGCSCNRIFMKKSWGDEVDLFSRFAVSRPQIGSGTSFSVSSSILK